MSEGSVTRSRNSSSVSGKILSNRLLPALLSRLSPLLRDPSEDPDDNASEDDRDEPPEDPDDDPLLSADAGGEAINPTVAHRAMIPAPTETLKRDMKINLTPDST